MGNRPRKIALALAITALLTGCGPRGTAPAGTGGGGVTIAASFYPIYIMLLNVTQGVPGVSIVNMTKEATGCLHDYSATPDDMKKLEDAAILVVNGAGMEGFMDKVIGQFPHLKIVDSSAGIETIKDGLGGDNPHLWVSISNAIRQVKNISGQLSALDPARAAGYTAHANAYVKKLEALRDSMHASLDGLKNKDIITFHEAFPYFAREFGLNVAGVIEREPGSEPSARELAKSIDTINALHVRALFAEPQYPATAAETIAAETGCRVYVLDPAVTGPEDANAYLDIMQSNLKVLEEALK